MLEPNFEKADGLGIRPNVRFKKDFFPKSGKNRDFLAILEQFLGVFSFFFQLSTIQFIF